MRNPKARVPILREESLDCGLIPQELFLKLLCLERKRTERSGRRFALMLLDAGDLLKNSTTPVLASLIAALTVSSRDTDLKGWYKTGSVIGVIFTEIAAGEDNSIVQALSTKLTAALYDVLSIRQVNEIRLSFHIFPEDWDSEGPDTPVTATLQLEMARHISRKKVSLSIKRLIDVTGGLIGLIFCLPVFLVIAVVIKLTSRGPVLYRQTRLGQYGKKFTFLKFRSMYANNDPRIHQEYVTRFIVGATGTEQVVDNHQKLYKLTTDPRITPIGRFLRNTSLDELPQLLNVLLGDMSIVGPRPPVTYEYEHYELWHKQRLLAVKPGITGLWQVHGRSRVKFDEMVRLDIRYARSWTLWLDIKILLQTPRAVLSGIGAC
jgi:lipopolysaccharide/colanic/teichoic acid biosynthesis glycosyltransferase